MSELTPEGIIALVREAVRAEVSSRFDALERLVDRRVSEVSAEVHGAAQLMDYSEANLSAQLSRIQDQIGRFLNKTFELGRAPTADEANEGTCCDSGCGCQ